MRIITCLAVLVLGTVVLHAGVGRQQDTIPEEPTSSVTALTLNIRYNNPGDGVNAWPARRGALIEYLKKSEADFIGLQEATPRQLLEVSEALEGYAFIARTRDADDSRGEAQVVTLGHRPERKRHHLAQ